MRKEFVFTLFSLLLMSLFSSCTENAVNDHVETFWVNSSRVDCVTGDVSKQCLQIFQGEDPSSAEWGYLYKDIEGFDFERGYFQRIEVKETSREKGKVPVDASTLEYTLVKVLDKIEDSRFAIEGNWTATSISGQEIMDILAIPTLSIDLQKMQVSGMNGCNNYTGEITRVTESILELGAIASTKKMCLDMSIPDSYDQALNSIVTYKLMNGELVFMDKDGARVLSFTKVE